MHGTVYSNELNLPVFPNRAAVSVNVGRRERDCEGRKGHESRGDIRRRRALRTIVISTRGKGCHQNDLRTATFSPSSQEEPNSGREDSPDRSLTVLFQ